MWNIGFPGTPGGGSVQLWGACPGDPRDFHLEADDGVRLPVDAEQSTPGVSKISAVLTGRDGDDLFYFFGHGSTANCDLRSFSQTVNVVKVG